MLTEKIRFYLLTFGIQRVQVIPLSQFPLIKAITNVFFSIL